MSAASIKQIADALGTGKRAAEKRAERGGWSFQESTGRGGKRRLYALADLPDDVQAALLRHCPELAPQKTESNAETATEKKPFTYDRDALWNHYERRPQRMKDQAAERLKVLDHVMAIRATGKPLESAFKISASHHNRPWRTVRGWYHGTNGKPGVKSYAREDWLAALMPGYAGNIAHTECSPEAWEAFKADYLRPESPAAAACWQRINAAAKQHGWIWPSKRTVQRWVNEIPVTVRVLKREGENALMRLYPPQERTVRDIHAMEWINGDGYYHNVFVKWPDGSTGRPKTWFWQDVRTRKILGWYTDHSENSDAIRLALGGVIERYGIPEHVTIDNTRSAANKWMTGGVANRYRFKVRAEDPLGILPTLGITVHWTTVHNGKGHGQAKPVERAFGVGGLGEYVDKHPRFAGAYTGASPVAKPDNYGSRAVDIADFEAGLAESIAMWNALPNRRTEVCGGLQSFDQAFTESYEASRHLIRQPTQAQKRLWLLAAESIRVQTGGCVVLQISAGPTGRNRYQADALIGFAGQKVAVRFDPAALHEPVHCYTLDGRYIDAAECIEAAGFGDSQAGREWRRQLNRRKKADKLAAESQTRMDVLQAAELMRGDEPPAEPAPEAKVVRGDFERRRVSGSDVAPEDDPDADMKSRFDDTVSRVWQAWKDKQL